MAKDNNFVTEQAFLAQIEENKGIIYKILHMYVDEPEEKEDLYQEVLLQTWHAKNRFRGDAKFSTWLYKICLNTVLTAIRKEKKRKHSSLDAVPEQTAFEDQSETRERSEVLRKAIKQLSEIERTLVMMHLDGFSNPEIAEFLGISLNHTSVKLHRIKIKLTEIVQQYERIGLK
ncbi:MAG: sigma-70 family RNA polymerase sigma factor [Cryomorphaceae bacterium]|nr:sigma-70 family RNA polymerase sigma factor [Cryomorphaceae bacterium]